jgi:hypothetical protein
MVRGEVDHVVGFIGVPGCGKTMMALKVGRQLQREMKCYFFAHDSSYRLKDKFPDGTPTGVRRFSSVSLARAALQSNPNGCLAIATRDANSVVDLAIDTSATSLGDKWDPVEEEWQSTSEGQESSGTPSIVLIDEIVQAEGAGAYRLGDRLKDVIATRRHRHVALLWTTQSPTLVHYQFLSLCTRLYLFHCKSKKALARLEDEGVPPEVVRELPKLPIVNDMSPSEKASVRDEDLCIIHEMS